MSPESDRLREWVDTLRRIAHRLEQKDPEFTEDEFFVLSSLRAFVLFQIEEVHGLDYAIELDEKTKGSHEKTRERFLRDDEASD